MGWQTRTITLDGDEPVGVFDVQIHQTAQGVFDRIEDKRFFPVGTQFHVDGCYCKISQQSVLQDRYAYDIKPLSEPHDKGEIYDAENAESE